eukprot:4209148-Pyramimonas_sp.AAC.1
MTAVGLGVPPVINCQVEDADRWSSDHFPVFIKYDEPYEIYGCPSREYPGLIKVCPPPNSHEFYDQWRVSYTGNSTVVHYGQVALHGGPDCDPDNRSLVPGYLELEDAVAPFISKHFKGVSTKPSMAEACMYTLTPDQDFLLDFLPESNKNVVIGTFKAAKLQTLK